MRRPHMSTGAWIFSGLISAAVIAPTAVYAAATSTVAVGNTTNSITAAVTSQRQLLTATVAPSAVVHFSGRVTSSNTCGTIYTPPAGKGVVITSVTYDEFNGSDGQEIFAELSETGCTVGVDVADTERAFDTQSHQFPLGLPMHSVSIYLYSAPAGGSVEALFTGYLIPATQVPAARPAGQLSKQAAQGRR